MRKVQVTALVAALAVTAATAAGASAAGGPTVRFVRLTPVTVQGAHFLPREQVRVTLRAGSVKRSRRTQSTAAGSFRVSFGWLREKDRCGVALTLTAVGAGGDRAFCRLPPRECPTSATSRQDD